MSPPGDLVGAVVRPVDDAVRRRVASDLQTTFLLQAGAGTGKTSALVERYVACLSSEGAPPVAEVVAITFTEKAAGELRQRVRGRLESAVADETLDPATGERLGAALAGLDDAPISTIHSFAARLLRERPVEAGVDPAFTQLDEAGAELLRDRLWRDWLAGLLDRDDDAAGAGGAGPLAQALRAGVRIEEIQKLAFERFSERYAVADAATPPAPDLIAACAGARRAAADLVDLAQTCADDGDRLKVSCLDLAAVATELPATGELHDLGLSLTVAAARAARLTPKNAGRAAGWPGGKERATAARDALRDLLAGAAAGYGAHVAALALAVAAGFARAAADAQRDAGALDFDDLLGRARDLLAGTPGVAPERVIAARRHFQQRYRYILVDEFQDTDPLQAEIAFLLSEREPSARSWRDVELEPGKLFLVGDPKQSIYRFRRADIAMYDEVRRLIEAQGGATLELVQNFRTVRSVVSWVNGLFGGLMPEAVEGLQPRHADLVPLRDDPGAEPGVLLVRPSPAMFDDADGPDGASPDDLSRREARLVADLLSGIERTGWRVRDAAAGWRAARPGDVAVLLPTFTRVGFYEQALREAGLPYRVDGGRTFYGRREVLDTLAALRAVDAAADPIAVYAALHGGLFALSDDRLYAYRAAGGEFDYLRAVPVEGFADVAAALADLCELHGLRNRRPVAETLDDLVRRTHLLESLALWADDGEQAIANIGELVSQADEFAHSAEASFHAFVVKAMHDADAADTAESPVGEPGEFVRVMTVHKAKGLEFPIVVLAAAMLSPRSADRGPLIDRAAHRLDCSLSCPAPDAGGAAGRVRYQTREYDARFAREKQALDAERVRLLYVALTRAADLLVLPLVTGEPRAGSLQGFWQGASDPAGDGQGTLEWSAGTAGPPQAAPPSPPTDPLAARAAWRDERVALLALAARPAPVFAPSALERLEPPDWDDQALPVASPPAASDGAARARALALGTAVHAVLELVSLDDDAALDGLAAVAAMRAGLPDETARVAALARACWRAAPLRGAAHARHERELPVCVVHDGVVIEGAIDLVYREAATGAWTIVDYKTDAHPDPQTVFERYGGQAGAYALAFEAASGERVEGVDVLLAALPDSAGAATVVHLPFDDALRDLVARRLDPAAEVEPQRTTRERPPTLKRGGGEA